MHRTAVRELIDRVLRSHGYLRAESITVHDTVDIFHRLGIPFHLQVRPAWLGPWRRTELHGVPCWGRPIMRAGNPDFVFGPRFDRG